MTFESNGHASGNGHLPSGPVLDVPMNIDAELGVLGSILLDNSVLKDVIPTVDVGDFFRDDHQVLFRAIRDLHARGEPVDTITLAEELERRDQFRAIGGDDTLARILDGTPQAANGHYYAQIVRQKAATRAVIEAAQKTIEDARSNRFTAQELFERAGGYLGHVGPIAHSGAITPRPAATLADVRKVVGATDWLWDRWLIDAHLTVLASEPGVGKTRLVLDLCRRMWSCLEWPNGQMATRPMHTPTLWVAADRHFSQLMTAAAAMGLPDEALFFNAPPETPTGGLLLDEPGKIAELAGRAVSCRAGLVVIDTINKTTRRPLYRPEEAEAFFGPLLDLALQTHVPILALTHLSKGGDPLDRRIEGTCRVSWRLEWPDRDGQPNRRRLWVPKSIDELPAPLGVTMGSEGNTYDLNPPVAPEASRGRAPKELRDAMTWLADYLSVGPALCRNAIDAGMKEGLPRATLFRAKDRLGVITEGAEREKYWRLAPENREDDGPAF